VFSSILPYVPKQKLWIYGAVLLVLICPVIAFELLSLGQFNSPNGFSFIWHHWGAYVAPVQAMYSGGIPFKDFPVQYGMGPTLLIAAFGFNDFWHGVYYATAWANGLYFLTLSLCLYFILHEMQRGYILLALFAMSCAVLIWAGLPSEQLGFMVMPSRGGMRYLPLALLVLYILYHEHMSVPGKWLGYYIWFFNLAWSPESGIYATIVWCPYSALCAAQACAVKTPAHIALAVARSGVVALGVAALAMTFLTTLFRIFLANGRI